MKGRPLDKVASDGTARNPFVKRLNSLIESSEKPLVVIAEEVGYDKPNVISMFRFGKMKVPMTKIPALAKSLGADPVHLLRLYMIEYAPELLDMIDVTIGHSVTKNEMKVVETFRKVTKGEDPLLSSKALEQVKKAIQDAV